MPPWASERAEFFSAWHGHVAFGHWITREIQPRQVVELGTHNGVSFASFCNAIGRCGIPAKCFAIDTWTGDSQTGIYGEHVYTDLFMFQQKHFGNFSALVRCSFDDACPRFGNGSIDLLHIDGLHTYEAVKHDFETWLPKLSTNAVVLFHDIDIRDADFGVWKLWDELSNRYPSFAFRHSAGLGVLAVGPVQTEAVRQLCQPRSAAAIEQMRLCFAQASDRAYQDGQRVASARREAALQEIAARGENIALHRPTSQSSYYEDDSSKSKSAVNGIKNGRYGFHTKHEVNPWWMVDLGAVTRFDEIILYNRLEAQCLQRARFVSVVHSSDGRNWTELYSHDGTAFGGIDGFPLKIECHDTNARFVRLLLKDTQFFHLDEVEIYRRR